MERLKKKYHFFKEKLAQIVESKIPSPMTVSNYSADEDEKENDSEEEKENLYTLSKGISLIKSKSQTDEMGILSTKYYPRGFEENDNFDSPISSEETLTLELCKSKREKSSSGCALPSLKPFKTDFLIQSKFESRLIFGDSLREVKAIEEGYLEFGYSIKAEPRLVSINSQSLGNKSFDGN